MRADRVAGADAHHPRGGVFEFGILRFRFAQELQRLFHGGEDLFSARIGKLHALVRAVEQLAAKLVFQLFDGLRHRGLRDVKFFRRFGERAAFCNRVKHAV